jgi:hypothetical protein
MNDSKSCIKCRYRRRTQLGPHEWAHDCDLRQRDFPNADQCGQYHSGPDPTERDEK